jgi:hypothetical protein
MPSDEQFAHQFRTNQLRIENLRQELCRTWSTSGGTLAETWMYPELVPSEAERLRAELRQIGGNTFTVVVKGANCSAGVGVWSGIVIDLRQARIIRQGYASFGYGLDDDPPLCDCVKHVIRLGDGWSLEVGSYTWIS